MNMLIAAEYGQPLPYSYQSLDDTGLRECLRIHPLHVDGFVASALRFLHSETKQAATAGTPYMPHDDQVAMHEFTASARITGTQRGTVSLSATRTMLTIMLMRSGAIDITTETMGEMLRQMAASMAADASAHSPDVLLRRPVLRVERRAQRRIGKRCYLVPIYWRKFCAQLLVELE
jgi:hypothetical protein